MVWNSPLFQTAKLQGDSMQIKIIQNNKGCYNFLRPSEKTLKFSCGIFREDKLIEKNGQKCKLSFTLSDDHELCDTDVIANIFLDGEIGQLCNMAFEYSQRVISTTDLLGELTAFCEVYFSNKLDIETNFKNDQKQSIQKDIGALQRKMNFIPDLDDSFWDEKMTEKIGYLSEWIAGDAKMLEDFKEGSEGFVERKIIMDRRLEDLKKIKYLIKLKKTQ